jgi:hypothetical protein
VSCGSRSTSSGLRHLCHLVSCHRRFGAAQCPCLLGDAVQEEVTKLAIRHDSIATEFEALCRRSQIRGRPVHFMRTVHCLLQSQDAARLGSVRKSAIRFNAVKEMGISLGFPPGE